MRHFGTKGPVSILTKKFDATTTKKAEASYKDNYVRYSCLLYTSPRPRD